jgi:hypothetical protein
MGSDEILLRGLAIEDLLDDRVHQIPNQLVCHSDFDRTNEFAGLTPLPLHVVLGAGNPHPLLNSTVVDRLQLGVVTSTGQQSSAMTAANQTLQQVLAVALVVQLNQPFVRCLSVVNTFHQIGVYQPWGFNPYSLVQHLVRVCVEPLINRTSQHKLDRT